MGYSLGVDLGTTFVAAAVARPTGARMVPLGERSVALPALVHVGADGSATTGDVAEQRALIQPEGAVRELRRRLGEARLVRLGAASYPVTGLLGAQLRYVLRRVADAEGGAPERIVLTRPAGWDDARRARFDEVWAAAGLAAPLVVTEAEAAFHSAPDDAMRDGECMVAYDLGGGSFQATVLRRRGGGVEILGAPAGDERLGGVEFDGAVLDHVADVVGDGARIEIDGDDPGTVAALTRLRQDCILAKEALSTRGEAVVPMSLPGRYVEVRVTRATLEEMMRAPLESTMRGVAQTVRSAGLISSDLGAVLLLGGASRAPLVTELLTQHFGRPVRSTLDPKNAVALGAARIGATQLASAQLGTARLRTAPGAARTGAARGPAGPVPARVGGGPVRPVEALPAGAALGTATPDVPLPVLRLPPPPLDDAPRRPWSRTWLPLAAAAVAALVLAAVFVLAPDAGPDDPLPAPAGSPASAPATPTGPSAPSTPSPSPSPEPSVTTTPSAPRTTPRPSTRPTRATRQRTTTTPRSTRTSSRARSTRSR